MTTRTKRLRISRLATMVKHATALSLLCVLTACGQKGALYLPQQDATNSTLSHPANITNNKLVNHSLLPIQATGITRAIT